MLTEATGLDVGLSVATGARPVGPTVGWIVTGVVTGERVMFGSADVGDWVGIDTVGSTVSTGSSVPSMVLTSDSFIVGLRLDVDTSIGAGDGGSVASGEDVDAEGGSVAGGSVSGGMVTFISGKG